MKARATRPLTVEELDLARSSGKLRCGLPDPVAREGVQARVGDPEVVRDLVTHRFGHRCGQCLGGAEASLVRARKIVILLATAVSCAP